MENRKMMMLCLLLAAISSPVFTGEWKASVAKSLDALVKSCVVIPCSFTHAIDELPHSRLRGIWHLQTGLDQRIYHEDKTMILENFRGRTKLLGNLSQGNCTLEMIEIKDHDNGPFCFRVELVTGTKTSKTEKFSFFHSCVNFKMITEPPKPTLISPKTAIQGHPYTITCSVIHTCPSHVPKLTWSRGTAGEILEVHREIHQGTWEAQSNLTFITEEKDNHTDITCTAEFFGGRTSTETLTLHVKPISSPVFTGEWKASVAKSLDALVKSCVVIPCSYTHAIDELPHSRLRGIWHYSTEKEQRIYHDDQTMILENFRGRTKLLGNLSQGNCTLEMIEIKDHDNGPFCFRVELVETGTKISETEKFSFVDSCVNFKMITEPPKPTLIPPKTAIQGYPYTITCSVIHTCPSHVPQLTWSRGTAEEILEVHREIHQGTWEAQSNLTFITEEKDNHTDITCTAEFFGGRTSTEKLTLYVKPISSPVFTGEWKASVAKNLDALVTSCVVIPCSFTHAKDELPHSRLRGIWHLSTDRDQRIYHEDQTMILENIRSRTKLLGNLGQGNCALEMIEIKDHDNGPFCFRVELVTNGTETSKTDKFSFVDSCVTFKMITEPPKPILIPPKTAIQGHPYTITCLVHHTCPSHIPQLTWSRGTAEEILEVHREIHQGTWEAQSNLTFITEEKDDHTDITCTAEFFGGTTSTETLTLHVKPISPVFTGEWKASVAKSLDALVTSCVVIPCSFTHAIDDLPHSRLRGIWHLSTEKEQCVYHDDQTMILENYRGHTKLLGNLGQGNCTMEMTEIKDHDNGPFCFRVELVTNGTETSKTDKFSFVDSCVTFKMITEPPKPTLIPPTKAIQGHAYTVTCSVIHTCPSHIPQLTWSRGTAEEIIEVHREIHQGTWEAHSTLTFITEEKDDHTDITCTAEFFGGRTSTEKLTLHVKRTENYNHIIIPVVVGISTSVIIGGLCIFIWKKYK